MTADDLVDVHLLQLPVDVWARAQEHSNELQREFALMSMGAASGDAAGAAVPARLLSLVQRLRGQYAARTSEQEQQLLSAVEQGDAVLDDLVYRVPPPVAEACLELRAMFDEADQYCQEGKHLLTLTTPPDLVAFRHWFLDEFVRQVRGEQPTPWPGHPAGG